MSRISSLNSKPNQLIVYLHGMGDNPDLNPWYDGYLKTMSEAFPDALIYVPTLPEPLSDNDFEKSPDAPDTKDLQRTDSKISPAMAFAMRVALRPVAQYYAHKINADIANIARQHEISHDKIAVLGFSAGAVLGAYAQLSAAKTYAAVFLRSGFFFGTQLPSLFRAQALFPRRSLDFVCSQKEWLDNLDNPLSYAASAARLRTCFNAITLIIEDEEGHAFSEKTTGIAIERIKQGLHHK